MAEALDDGEFWLPSEFLTDDDILMGSSTRKCDIGANLFCFPSDFPTGSPNSNSNSDSNSPVESLVGSTETESDEDDYLSGFTRQMAKSLLETNNSKTRVVAGSPQSPLCGIGSWSGKSSGSSRGSPNDGPSLVSSPPSTPSLNGKDDAWDLLYAAAGQVVRMKLNDEVRSSFNNRGLLGVPQKSAPVYSNPALTQQQLQANHFYQLKQQQQQLQQCSSAWGSRQMRPGSGPQQQQLQQQQIPINGRPTGLVNGRCNNRPLGLPPSAWPPLQQQQQQQQQQEQQNGSGMRAVFLGGSGARRESTGTGVFLPRRNGHSDSRRKPGCSTVLLPARVVQALNLNFVDIGNGGHNQSRYIGGGYLPQAQKRSYRPQPAISNEQLQLPQEWTY